MFDSLLSLPTCWEQLQKTSKPIVIYGMGDGAEHILSYFEKFGITVSDFFASDAFVRGHSFHGIRVKKFSEIKELYSDFVIVTAFAVQDSATIEYICSLNNEYELYAPDVPVAGETLFDRDFLQANKGNFLQALSLLSDEESRETYYNLIAYKLTGKIDYLMKTESQREQVLAAFFPMHDNEAYFDLGAYTGDTIEEFLKMSNNSFSQIYALEPDAKNYKKMISRLERLGVYPNENVHLINKAVWDSDKTLFFSAKAGRNSTVSSQGIETPATCVDSVLGKNKVSYIKMDVEGSEKEALIGAFNTIRTSRPKMLISAYHRSEDLFALPLLVNKICAGYKFYLRRFQYIPAWEII